MNTQQSQIAVKLILTGEREYSPTFRNAFEMPEDVRALWNIYCDAQEDPLYHIVPNDMTDDQKKQAATRPWKTAKFGRLSTWSHLA